MTMTANKAELLASAGDFSGYQQLYGLTPEQTASMSALWQQQNAPKVTYSGGGDGGSNSYMGQDADLYTAIRMSGLDPYTFLAMYGGKYDISASEIAGVVEGYNNANQARTTNLPYTASSGNNAAVSLGSVEVLGIVKSLANKGWSKDRIAQYILDNSSANGGAINESYGARAIQQVFGG